MDECIGSVVDGQELRQLPLMRPEGFFLLIWYSHSPRILLQLDYVRHSTDFFCSLDILWLPRRSLQTSNTVEAGQVY